MSSFMLIALTFLVLNALVGMVANGFIVLFNCMDWLKSKRLSSADLILCCLGLSRFTWLVIMILDVIMASFFETAYLQNYMWTTISTMWLFTTTVNLWFAAWLSVLYFIKVAIFSQPIFLQVKQRFSGLVPWLLLGSVVFSVALAIIIMTLWTWTCSTYNPYHSLSSNSSSSTVGNLPLCRFLAILLTVPNIIPFMLFLSSSIFLISSLWKHLRRMQRSGTGAKDLSTQVHLRALRALVSFAVLYLSSFVLFVSQSNLSWGMKDPAQASVLFYSVRALYHSGHAIILILTNPKLKLAWVRLQHHFIRL